MINTPICVRWSFIPERAAEFIEPIEINGSEFQPTVSQQEYESIDEVMEILYDFDNAILDANALINGKVINLSDHPLDFDGKAEEVE